ncbi:carbohydrate sulfotransferase 1-like [Ptychodera flava]|uniref:carbohydrate sulfotransferase 1-like n=1 Tax=Ptychodera flava TaxID=63121 RepID=UPI00396A826E
MAQQLNGKSAAAAAADHLAFVEDAISDLKEQLTDLKQSSNMTEAQYRQVNDSITELLKTLRGREDDILSMIDGNPYSHYNHVQSTPQTNVLVLASMRTGSSFIGEILNRNPKVLYAFEPIKQLMLKDGAPTLPFRGANQLRDFYACDFSSPDLKKYLDFYNSLAPPSRLDYVKAWVNKDNCKLKLSGYGWESCKRISADGATKSCRKYDIRAVKIIRIRDLSMFTHLMADPEVNLRVLNVVRDPRGMMSSVMPLHLNNYQVISKRVADRVLSVDHFNKNPGLRDRLKAYCDSMLRNYLLGQQPWFPRGRHMVIRYEDAAYDPRGMAAKIYSFLGVSMHGNVLRWLDVNTNIGDNERDLNYIYSTRRNSGQTAESWRRKVTFDLAEAIQNTGSCREFMNTMGYRIVHSAAELLNQSLSLVSPRQF